MSSKDNQIVGSNLYLSSQLDRDRMIDMDDLERDSISHHKLLSKRRKSRLEYERKIKYSSIMDQ